MAAARGSRGDPAVPKPLLSTVPTLQRGAPCRPHGSVIPPGTPIPCSAPIQRPHPCPELPLRAWRALGAPWAPPRPPQRHLHPSRPLFPPAVTQTGSKIRISEGKTAPEEPRRSIQARWKVGAPSVPGTGRSPPQEPLHRPWGDVPGVLRSPLGRWPLSQLSLWPLTALGAPRGPPPAPHPSLRDGAEPPLRSVPHLPRGLAVGQREGGPGEPRTVARGSVSPQEGAKTWPRGT